VGPVVTLLVTDIVGSTRLWALYPAEMAEDLAIHDGAIRDVVTVTGGSVFKHTGDGAMAVFADPFAAVTAAADIQRAIASVRWRSPDPVRVRVAVNTGAVVERDGDLFGTPVNRVARLLEWCPPGAVVVGDATAALLKDGVLDGLDVYPLGPVELRGLVGAETVHALVGRGLSDVGPILAAEEFPLTGRLPIADEPLVGRGEELKAVWAAVLAHPVVSIIGVGGMGKTRLALEAAGGLASEFVDGTWWCDLSVATSLDAVAPVIFEVLAIRPAAGRSPIESICDRLAGRNALVVFDNCEHVITAVHEVVTGMRAGCPTVRLLTTGREALGVRGEHVLPLSSLPVEDALALFVDRAEAAGADVDLDPDGLDAARAVCVRLDGIPLAVELAAARCRSMTPREIDARLDDRFRLLRSGRPSSERHRTLQAAVSWSYDLLRADERDLFESIAVFADGCLIDGIAAVGGLDEIEALDVLDRLVARSMVTAVATPLGTRYRQLETLRQYAEDRLVERGVINETRDRHLGWMGELAASMGSLDGTSSVRTAFHRYAAEIDNLRVAVAHAMSSGRRDAATAIVAGTWRFIESRPTVEVRDWFEPSLGPPPWSPNDIVVAAVQTFLAYIAADFDTVERFVAAIPPRYLALPVVAHAVGSYELFGRGDPDRADAVVSSWRPGTEYESHLAGLMTVYTGAVRIRLQRPDADLDKTRHLAEELLARARRSGDEIAITRALAALAFVQFFGDAVDVALAAAAEASAVADSIGAGLEADTARNALGLALSQAAAAGRRDAALVARELRRAIDEAQLHNNRILAVTGLDAIAVLVAQQDPETAYLLNLVSQRLDPIGSVLDPRVVDRIEPRRRSELESEAVTTSHEQARALAFAALERHFPSA
jgi:predicted ATPase/class 3 adenylate cyclase